MEIDWLITLDCIAKQLAFVHSFAIDSGTLGEAITPRSEIYILLKKYITLCKEIELESFKKNGVESLISGRDVVYQTNCKQSIGAYLEYQTKTGTRIAFMPLDMYKLDIFSENMLHIHHFAATTNPLVLQILINFESKFRECMGIKMLLKTTPVGVYIYLLGLTEFRAAGLPDMPANYCSLFKEKETDELNVGLFFDPAELQKYFTGEKFKLLDLSDVNEVLMNLRALIDFIGIQSTNLMIL
jgi:hypothetical protein